MTEPIPFDELPLDIQRQFYYAGRKGEWTEAEAYEHLVPEHLRNNPDEIRAWMNGDTLDGVTVPDKDISRIISGKNGGEYSVENTIMEDMSANRSRGAANMTPEEYQQIVETNAVDAELIENHYLEKLMFEETEIITPVAEASLAESAMGAMWDGVLPAAAAVTAGAYVGDKFQTREDRLGYGALAAGGAALLACTPPGQLAMLGFAGYKIFKAGKRVVDGLNQEAPINPTA